MGLVDASVLADWGAWTAQFEGRVAWMYLDVRGLVTTGLGCLVDPVGAALPLPWQHVDGGPVGATDIETEWARVKAMPAALDYHHYRGPLRLSDDAIDALAARRVEADAEQLARYFPDIAKAPPSAQKGILSMAWAMGPAFPSTWPHFSAAVRAGDWAAAAENCTINATGNAGVIPRNAANKALFLAAAGEM